MFLPVLGVGCNLVGDCDSVVSGVLPPHDPQLSALQNRELTMLISEFKEIFSEQLGNTHPVQHDIKLALDSTASRSAPYPLSPDKLEFVKSEISILKEQGIAEDAPSAMPCGLLP